MYRQTITKSFASIRLFPFAILPAIATSAVDKQELYLVGIYPTEINNWLIPLLWS